MMDSGLVLLFSSIIDKEELAMPTTCWPKFKLRGERRTKDPLPVRVTLWEPPSSLSVTVRVSIVVPGAVGKKVTLMLQLPPGGTGAEQVLVSEKSGLLAPVLVRMVMPLMLSTEFPVLVTVDVCGRLAAPTS
jgi:hypothetical protein